MLRTGTRFNKRFGLSGAAFLLVIAFLVKKSVPAPYLLLHHTESLSFLPPLWILGLLWLGIYGLLGFTAGQICAVKVSHPQTDVQRFKGGFYFLLLLLCSFLWYVYLFKNSWFLLSWIFCGMTVISSFFCGAHWYRISRACGCFIWIVTTVFLFWWLIQLLLMLHI